jgi:hypothetical protein
MADDFWTMFRAVEAQLWDACKAAHPGYKRSRYDGWVLCPRAHAAAHLRCVIELTPNVYPGLPGALEQVKSQFGQLNRFFDGEDLVFAVGDVQ